MTMKTESEIRKQKEFLEYQIDTFKDLTQKHSYAEGAKQILKNIEHEVEIFKWVLNEPNKYGEWKR
jgi:hypothetical protein